MKIESQAEKDRKKKQKKQEDWLIKQIDAILEKSLKIALDQALDDIFKDWG